jgi:glyoxylate reductase
MRAGKYESWDPLLLLGHDIHHKTIGIVGFGRIGYAVAKRAKGSFYLRFLASPCMEQELAKLCSLQTI